MRGTLWALLALCLLVPPCRSETWLLSPDGSGDFPTIQAALQAAADGDTLLLGDGVFWGEGNWDLDLLGKAVVLRSSSGDPAICQISGGGSHRGLRCTTGEGPDTRIEGITISNCLVSGEYPEGHGAGVLCIGSSPCFTNCRFELNTADNGGAFTLDSSSAEFTGCVFTHNHAVNGGAGGISNGQPSFRDCVFSENTSGGGGGAVICWAEAQISDCLFEGNHGHNGGAVLIYRAPTLSGCTFSGNSASNGGGAIGCYSLSGHPVIVGCTLVENTAPHGGVVKSSGEAWPIFVNCILAFSAEGGSVFCDGGAITLNCCDVFGNSGGDWIDCIAGQQGQMGNFSADPLFCGGLGAEAPWSLAENSPCAEGNNPCGQIGSAGVGCGEMGVCCVGEACEITTEEACLDAGGDWRPWAIDCDPSPCFPEDGDLSDGVLIMHAPAGLTYTSDGDLCQRYAEQFALTHAGQQRCRVDPGSGQNFVWYVLASWGEPKAWCTTEFGLGAYGWDALTLLNSGCCPPACLEVSTPNWPGPGEGTQIYNAAGWSGDLAPVYWFAGYAYAAEQVPLAPHPLSGFAGFRNCYAEEWTFPAACLGALGIWTDGVACYPPSMIAACCTGEVCQLLARGDCEDLAGEWLPLSESCEPNPCLGQAVEAGADRAVASLEIDRTSLDRARVTVTLPARRGSRRIALGLYDAEGRLVRGLAEGPLPAGVHEFTWDGSDERGRLLGAGVYLCRLSVEGEVVTQRIVRLR